MAVTLGRSNGQVPNSIGDMLAAVSNDTLIFNITLSNTTGGAVVTEVYLRTGGTDRQIFNASIGANATVVISTKHLIENGDSVRTVADTSTAIDYWLSYADIT